MVAHMPTLQIWCVPQFGTHFNRAVSQSITSLLHVVIGRNHVALSIGLKGATCHRSQRYWLNYSTPFHIFRQRLDWLWMLPLIAVDDAQGFPWPSFMQREDRMSQ